MLSQLRPATVMVVLFSVLTGLAYPLAVTGVSQALMAEPANGSLITRDGVVIGSRLVGQNFTSEGYFHGRPSATSGPDPQDASRTVDAPYNAANSAGSNLGPTSQKLSDRVKAAVRALGGGPEKPVPADAVTTSASGLDPDISSAFATLQVPRVAAARNVPEAQLETLVADNTTRVFGAALVNVLALNLALDKVAPAPAARAVDERPKGGAAATATSAP